jgi:hypothetical protein
VAFGYAVPKRIDALALHPRANRGGVECPRIVKRADLRSAILNGTDR